MDPYDKAMGAYFGGRKVEFGHMEKNRFPMPKLFLKLAKICHFFLEMGLFSMRKSLIFHIQKKVSSMPKIY